jgi:hypothetical protein
MKERLAVAFAQTVILSVVGIVVVRIASYFLK